MWFCLVSEWFTDNLQPTHPPPLPFPRRLQFSFFISREWFIETSNPPTSYTLSRPGRLNPWGLPTLVSPNSSELRMGCSWHPVIQQTLSLPRCVRASKNMSLACITQGLEDRVSFRDPQYFSLMVSEWDCDSSGLTQKYTKVLEKRLCKGVCLCSNARYPPYSIFGHSILTRCSAPPSPPSYPLTRYRLMIFASYSSGIEEAGLWRCHRYLESRCTPLHHASRVGAAAVCTITQHEQWQCSV